MPSTAPNYDNVLMPGSGGIRVPTEGFGKKPPTMTVNASVTVNYGAAHADHPVLASESVGSVFLLTNADGTATTLTFPAVFPGKVFVVNNTSTSAVTTLVMGQTGISVATGKSAVLYMNATDVARASADV